MEDSAEKGQVKQVGELPSRLHRAVEARACYCYLATYVLQDVKPTGPKSDVPAVNRRPGWLNTRMAVQAVGSAWMRIRRTTPLARVGVFLG